MRLTSHLLVAIVGALALTAVALVIASAASAKSLTSARLCGPDECTPLNDKQSVMTILGGGGSTPPPTAAYYRFDVTFDRRVTHSYLYVPSAELVAAEGPIRDVVWYPARGRAREMLATAAGELEPFARPAAWPSSIIDPVFTPTTPAATDGSRSWAPWLLAAAILVVGAAGYFARRLVALRAPVIER